MVIEHLAALFEKSETVSNSGKILPVGTIGQERLKEDQRALAESGARPETITDGWQIQFSSTPGPLAGGVGPRFCGRLRSVCPEQLPAAAAERETSRPNPGLP